MLLTMIITWWVQYRWRNAPHWTLFLFLWLLVAPLILYLVTALLFPTSQDDAWSSPTGAEHYYANNTRAFLLFRNDLCHRPGRYACSRGVSYFLCCSVRSITDRCHSTSLYSVIAAFTYEVTALAHAFFAVFLSHLQSVYARQ